jgi:hypothetical protein
MFHLKRNPTTKHEPLHAQNYQTNSSIELLYQCTIVAADALLQIGTALIWAVLSLDVHLSQTDASFWVMSVSGR